MISKLIKRNAPDPFLYPGEEIHPIPVRTADGGEHGSSWVRISLHGGSKRALETGRLRLEVAVWLFTLIFVVIGARLVDLMALKADAAVTVVRTAWSERVAPPVGGQSRAEIVDRNGVVLATNLPTVNLYANSRSFLETGLNAGDSADRLVRVLPHLNRNEVVERLISGRPFVYLDRNLTPRQQAMVNALGIPGVNFEGAERRAYLHGQLASHVLGATDPDNRGLAGIEQRYNDHLRTSDQPLRLTLDIRVQHAVRHVLSDAIATYHALGGTAIVMDVNTGEILSMVSLPDYDPERFGLADEVNRFNRATLGVYELGSTFKVINTAIALDSGVVSLGDRYDATRPLQVSRFSIRDSHPRNSWLSVSEVLKYSSNIGSARMALAVGGATQRAYLERLGLLSPLPIDLPESGTPMYPSTWRDINTMTISYGHGLSVTPLHLAAATAATINGGLLRTPSLVMGPPSPAQQVLAPETSNTMRGLLRQVVSEGTGRSAEVAGYLVGGKTGTAEKVSARGGYDRRALMTSFVAAFPMNDPRYLVLTVLDEPKGLPSTHNFATAGWNAAPTTGRIIQAIGPLLGVQPQRTEPQGRGTITAALPGPAGGD